MGSSSSFIVRMFASVRGGEYVIGGVLLAASGEVVCSIISERTKQKAFMHAKSMTHYEYLVGKG